MIAEFAAQHRLRVTKDACGDAIIAGRIGTSNIYEYDTDRLGVMFITDAHRAPRTNRWNRFKAACLAADMTAVQIGDAEGAFAFDPTDAKQAAIAITGIRARAKRRLSPEQTARLTERLRAIAARKTTPNTPQIISEGSGTYDLMDAIESN